ncbi:hypothetical protein, partial [Oharaeibacter diazotrophicus]
MTADSLKREKVASYLAGLSPAAREMLLRRLETTGADADPELRLLAEAARTVAPAQPAASSYGAIVPRGVVAALQAA